MKKYHIFKVVELIVLCCAMYGCEKDNPTDATDKPGSIYGTVTDKSTGDCISTAGVELMPKGLRTVTGSDGTFQFPDIEPGQYNLFITKVGYQDLKSNDIIVNAGEAVKGDVQIEKMPASLQIVDNSGNPITEIDFGSNEGVTSKTFNIFNGGTEPLNYTITKTANWIESISQATGTVNVGITFPIIITINRDLLAEGVNSTSLLITSPSAGGIELTVKATKGTPYTGNCTVVFELFSTSNDGWYAGSNYTSNYGRLGVSDGINTYQLTIQNGNVANYTYDFAVGTNISVVYSHGYNSSYTDRFSYRIYYADGDVIFEKSQGTISAGLQCTFTVDCSNPGSGGGGGSSNVEDWLYYGVFDNHEDCWGLNDGGTDEWAVMFPSSIISQYHGSITKVSAYLGETGTYTLRIYKGGITEPNTLLKKQSFHVSTIGWNTITLTSPLALPTNTSLWVSIYFSYSAGLYPKGASGGIGEPNARWFKYNGGDWYDIYDYNGNVDLCWEIKAYVADNVKGEKGLEMPLPQKPIHENIHNDKTINGNAMNRISTRLDGMGNNDVCHRRMRL